jgi:hypothetical protein
MKRVAILIAAFAALLRAEDHPKEFDPDVSAWLVITPPANSKSGAYLAFMTRANRRGIEWSVVADANRVKATLSEGVVERIAGDRPAFSLNQSKEGDPSAEPSAVHKVLDGWLASYNRGEFGAAVWWFSADGKDRRAISTHHVNQFITHQERVLAVEGLAHMGSSEGSVLEFRRRDHWTVETFIELPQSGELVTPLPDGRLCVVASDMLLALSLDGHLEVLIPNARWGILSPNSAIYDHASQTLFIGMRQFVARYKVTPANHSYDLTVPSKAFMSPYDRE